MWKSISGFLWAALASSAGLASDLTEIEARWLRGAAPVIAFAKHASLPLDIIVQPQATPGAAPLALAFVDGRCKLVLSMRGNPEAQATLDRIPPELLDVTLELMAAHEMGHCRRYLEGAWYGLPADFAAGVPDTLGPELRVAYANMQAARREEGYGDLVGLAWTQHKHPRQYAALYAWLIAERSRDLISGSHHDTLAWLRLAKQWPGPAETSIFSAAAVVWAAGLLDSD